MFVLIVGAGTIGSSVASWLISAGHEVAVVEINTERSQVLQEQLGSIVVTGDGTSVGDLSIAGAIRADVLIATTSSDECNLMSCQIAKHGFSVLRTMSLVNLPEHVAVFDSLGVDVCIDSTVLLSTRIQEELSPEVPFRLVPMPGKQGRTLVAIRVTAESGMPGRFIHEIPLPNGTFASFVVSRDGSAYIPNEETILRTDDEILAITSGQDDAELIGLLVTSFEGQR